ncbi:conserved hypothetical protein [Candidatus Caldarchaeum subterraneum]|uniref:EamA domain-containing protein n=1 Tax=Caldiarchaeum subterraneum TaxID=311458 RepID=E6P7S2_CALS0|nr:conserved hypothetical protein [Candidatus Caldarchaeum subterraneum]
MPTLWEQLSAFYGVASAVSWGAGNFYGGYASKKASVLMVVAVSQSLGLVLLLSLGILSGEKPPTTSDIYWSAAAGFFSGLGITLYYAALSRGSMGLAAPVTGVLTAAVPAVAGTFLEGVPSPLQAIGFLLAFLSIFLVTGNKADRLDVKRQLVPAAAAGLGFGLFLVTIGQVSPGHYYYPLVVSRLVTVSMVLAASLAKGHTSLSNSRLTTAAAGIFDTGGSFFYLLARQQGRLDEAGVLSSLYPVSTVLLAKTILGEKLGKQRTAGIICAAAATTLIQTANI